MKTFNEFLKESMSPGYAFDNAPEAETQANLWGFAGHHEVDGLYYPCSCPADLQRCLWHIRNKKLVGACESTELNESVLRYTWEEVTVDDVELYVNKNNLKLVRDPKDKFQEMFTAVRKNNPTKVVFRYDVGDMNLYSDYTLIQLEDGKAK